MFSKVLTVCLVLYTVQVLGASIKAKLSPEVQNVVQQIDMKSLLMEAEIKQAATDKKHEQDTVKLNTKLALKQLKTAVREGKGTLCGQVANLQMKAVEQRADDAKLCNKKLDLKELQQDLHGYLKNLNEEAKLVDKYCVFIHADAAEAAQCVTDSVAALEAKLNDVETVVSLGMTKYQSETEFCYKSVVDDVQLEAARIEIEMTECLNPTTAAPVVEDSSSSESKESSESSSNSGSGESKESNESGEGSGEATDAPAESSSEGGNSGEEGGDDQATEGDDHGEEGNAAEGSSAAPGNEDGDNDGESDVGEQETGNEGNDGNDGNDGEAPAEEGPATEGSPADNNDNGDGNGEGETPAEDTNNNDANEGEKVENTPAEDDNTKTEEDGNKEGSDDAAELPTVDEKIIDDDEVNIEY